MGANLSQNCLWISVSLLSKDFLFSLFALPPIELATLAPFHSRSPQVPEAWAGPVAAPGGVLVGCAFRALSQEAGCPPIGSAASLARARSCSGEHSRCRGRLRAWKTSRTRWTQSCSSVAFLTLLHTKARRR